MSYSDMSQEALASGGHHDLSYVASTPVVNRSTYDQHNSDPGRLDHLLNVRGGFVSVKRNVRTSQACDSCRKLKCKCDGMNPCKNCRDKSVECRDQGSVPKQAAINQANILDGINNLQAKLEYMMEYLKQVDARMAKVENLLCATTPLLPRQPTSSNSSPINSHELEYEIAIKTPEENHVEFEPGPSFPPGEPAVGSEVLQYVGKFPMSLQPNTRCSIGSGRGGYPHYARQIKQRVERPDYITSITASDFVYNVCTGWQTFQTSNSMEQDDYGI